MSTRPRDVEDLVAAWPCTDWVSEDDLAGALATTGHDVGRDHTGAHLFQGRPLRQLLAIGRRRSMLLRVRRDEGTVYTRPVPGLSLKATTR